MRMITDASTMTFFQQATRSFLLLYAHQDTGPNPASAPRWRGMTTSLPKAPERRARKFDQKRIHPEYDFQDIERVERRSCGPCTNSQLSD